MTGQSPSTGFSGMLGGAAAMAKRCRWAALLAFSLAALQKATSSITLNGSPREEKAFSAAVAVAFLLAGIYAAMGYWACLTHEGPENPSFDVFFRGANKTYLRGVLGTIITGSAAILVGLASFGAVMLVTTVALSRSTFLVMATTGGAFAVVIALAVAAVWIMTRIALWIPLVFRKDAGVIEAIRSSYALTRGRAGVVFLWVILPSLLTGVLPRFPQLRFVQALLDLLIVPILLPPITLMVYDRSEGPGR